MKVNNKSKIGQIANRRYGAILVKALASMP